jgi:hypothetical protein
MVDRLVLAVVNASLPEAIDARTLARSLGDDATLRRHLPHLAAFFLEVPVDACEQFVVEHGIAYPLVCAAYERVKAYTGESNADVDDWLRYVEKPA